MKRTRTRKTQDPAEHLIHRLATERWQMLKQDRKNIAAFKRAYDRSAKRGWRS